MTASDRDLLNPELSPAEVKLLEIVAAYTGYAEPLEIARRLGVSRQKVTHMVKLLSALGFMRVTRLSQAVYYEITTNGLRCIEERETA